jgi:hypothetical protein
MKMVRVAKQPDTAIILPGRKRTLARDGEFIDREQD